MDNLIDKLLKERDRLLQIKEIIGEDWDNPDFVFYRLTYTSLLNRIDKAIAQRMEITDILSLVSELKEFDL